MKKKVKLPTILGLLVLFAGLVSGVLLINSRTIFRLGAQAGSNPKNVRISNITSSSITVSWTTDKTSTGFVKWGTGQSNLNKVGRDSISPKSYTHWVKLTDLKPNEQVYFKINSEGEDWDNGGIPWQSKTNNQEIADQQSFNVSGSVVTQTGEPVESALVYVSISGMVLSATTSKSGSYLIPLSNYILIDAKTSVLEISVDAATEGTSTAVIYPQMAKNTPLIVLGKTYDFRTVDTTIDSDLPESDLSVPDQIEVSSRFEVGESQSPTSVQVTLDSIDDGEIVTTTDPEFFGTGPKSVEIEITVESEAQTTTLTPNNQGSWSWSPPNNLEPGEHKITVKWKDDSGILRTITRTFIVQASEGPAFESTPSASPTQTSLATSTPTVSPKATATSIASSTPAVTNPPLPETGNLTPTLGLFIMGIGILLSSYLIYKSANA